MGSNAESLKFSNVELAKFALTKETRKALNSTQPILERLNKSLTQKDEGTIKFIYSRLLDEQNSEIKNKALINQLKNDLMGACVPFYTELSQTLHEDLPPQVAEFFKAWQIDLNKLADELLHDITEFNKDQLPAKPEENKFRLSIWIEKVNNSNRLLKKLLA